MEIMHEQKCGCEKRKSGVSQGILCGLLPHTFCILFIIFSVLSITVLSSLLKPFLTSKYSFSILMILSLVLASISAIVYLRKIGALSWQGIKSKWKYFLSMYGSVLLVNLAMIYLIFPALANSGFDKGLSEASVVAQNYSLIVLKVDIPCSGHSYLIVDELKKVEGIKDIKFRLPNLFDVYFDSKIINEERILSLPIFKEFPVQKVVN